VPDSDIQFLGEAECDSFPMKSISKSNGVGVGSSKESTVVIVVGVLFVVDSVDDDAVVVVEATNSGESSSVFVSVVIFSCVAGAVSDVFIKSFMSVSSLSVSIPVSLFITLSTNGIVKEKAFPSQSSM